MVKIQNNSGVTVTSIDVSFDYLKSRSGSRAFAWTFFTGTDGTAWTANTSGDQSYAADANNTVISNPPLSTNKTFTITGITLAQGDFYYMRWHYAGSGGSTNAQGLSLDNVKLTLNAGGALTPPTLTAAPGATVDGAFNVTFTDDAVWRAAITGVTIGGTPLTSGYSVSAGQITFTPSASVPANLLQTSGSKNILVIATGYNNNPVTQIIGVGAPNKLGLNTQPGAPVSNGGNLTPQPVVSIQDQYGNTTTSTATVTANLGQGSWTLGGTTSKAAVNGVATFTDLNATSVASVTGATVDFTSTGLTHIESNAFNIPSPPLVYYSTGSADVTLLASWNSARNGSGSAPANFTNGDAFVIQNTHSMTTSGAWTISGSGGKLEIENGGTLTATSPITVSATTTFQIDNGGTYNHANTGAPASTIFAGTESFAANSTFNLQNWAGSSTAIPAVTFGNLTITWDPGATWQQSGSVSNVLGNFTLNNNSTFAMRLSASASLTLNVGGDFIITSGLLQFNNASGSAPYILNIGGNYTQTGGTFNPNMGALTLAVNFTGSGKTFTQSAGTLTNTAINWTVNNGASLTLANDLPVAAGRTLTVTGRLNLAGFNIAGGAASILAGAGTIALAGDITSQITGFTNNFTGTYEFTGAGQTVPSGTYSSLTVNGTGTTLGGNVTVTTLNLTSGNLVLGGSSLTANTVNGGSASSYVQTNGAGVLTINNVGASNVVFPVGNTSYNPITINNGGTPDNFTVGVQNTIDNPTLDNTHAVTRQWNISEAVAGGSSCTLTFQWNTADEGASMSHLANYVGHWNGATYDLFSTSVAGSNPWTASVSSITTFSPFVVTDDIGLPVELSSFTSNVTRNTVKLNWSTVSELNNSGFDIERKSVSGEWTKVSNVNGNGTSNTVHSYSFEDRNLTTGKYNYRLRQVDFNGNYKYYQLVNEVEVGTPSKYDLSQNYPNPFNPSTTINYELPKSNFVSLKIYDMMGREVASLVNQNQDAGFYSVKFDASKLSSGIYFYKIQAADFSAVKKLMLVK
jgi:hypothetical protein